MKNFKRMLLVAVAVVAMSLSASAGGFKWGVKAGVALNSIHFSEEILNDITNNDNHAGFTGGLMVEFTIPVINLGLDASVMYVNRDVLKNDATGDKVNRDYIEIPINLKYKLSLPVVNNIVTPYVFAGPSFAFKTSKNDIEDFVKNKKCDVALNLGLGVELFKHLQVSGSYGMGMTKAFEYVGLTDGNSADIDGKNRYWTITAAYLF